MSARGSAIEATRRSASTGSHVGGFTLVELIVVMAIIALLAGLSAEAFRAARRNYGLAASAGRIQGMIRAARNTSVSSGTSSFVVLDPVAREVWAQCYESLGEWSFEENGSTDGRVGLGLAVRGGGHYDCGTDPRFDPRFGVVVEAWIRHGLESGPKPPRSERPRRRRRLSGGKAPMAEPDEVFAVVEKPGAYALSLTSGGALVGSIGDFAVVTEDDVVAPNRWVFVALTYDGRELLLTADGVERHAWPLSSARDLTGSGRDADERAEDRRAPETIPVSSDPLTISSPRAPFPGDIDEVRLRGRSDRLVYSFADYEHLVGWKKVIHFDGQGHLDPRFHDRPVRVWLVELSDEQYARRGSGRADQSAQVTDFSLTFEEWLAGWDDDIPDLDQAEEEEKILERKYRDSRRQLIEVDLLGVVR